MLGRSLNRDRADRSQIGLESCHRHRLDIRLRPHIAVSIRHLAADVKIKRYFFYFQDLHRIRDISANRLDRISQI